MQTTLTPKPNDDPHDVLVVAPDVVLVAPTDEELSRLAHSMRHPSNSADPHGISPPCWPTASAGRYDVPSCRRRCPGPGRPGVDWQEGDTRPHWLPVGSVHRCGCHRLAVLRQCGQTDYREVGAEFHRDFIAAAGEPRGPRAIEPTCRSSIRGRGSTFATGSSGSDRPGRRRIGRSPVSRIGAVAPVDGGRSRSRGARDRAAQGQRRAAQGQPATDVPRHCQGFRAEPAAQDLGASAAVGRSAGAQAGAATAGRCSRSVAARRRTFPSAAT